MSPHEELARVHRYVMPFYRGTARGGAFSHYVQRLEQSIADCDAISMIRYGNDLRDHVVIQPEDLEEFLQKQGLLPQ